MKHFTYTDARNNLKKVMDAAIHDKVEVLIVRRNGEAAVMVDKDQWDAMQETMYLDASEANRRELRESIAQAERGELIEKDPDELLGP